ncbi:S8 family serine peptidase, partial [candidate division TA06 bacterium]|nr:S8 family serine peptidase [candidate division TA06 bacterium]
MKKYTIFVFLLFLTHPLFGAQGERGVITPGLQAKLNEVGPRELIRVKISMEDQIDPVAVERLVAGKSMEDRRKIVIAELKRLAETSQKEILTYLREQEKDTAVKDLQSLWINNMIAGKMSKGVIETIVKMDGIQTIDEDPLIKMIETSYSGEDPPKITSIEWNITRVDAPCAWSQGYRGQGVIVGNIDTGVNYNHSDLVNHFWRNDAEFFGITGVDDDTNGYVDDIWGYDFSNNDGDPIDDHGHGTHTAGTVAGDGSAGDTVGVALEALIMAIKVLNQFGSGSWTAIFNGVQYALDNGAQVLTLSIGGAPGFST